MKFKGTVIVIDPIHVSLPEDWEGTFDPDRGHYTPPVDKIELTDLLFGTTEMYSAKCKWDFYKPSEDGTEYVKFSSYTSSSNSFGVFYLEEVLKYNPNFAETLKTLVEGENYTILKDFEGEVENKIALCDEKVSYTDNEYYDYDFDDEDDEDYYEDDYDEDEESFGGWAPYFTGVDGKYVAIPKLVEEDR